MYLLILKLYIIFKFTSRTLTVGILNIFDLSGIEKSPLRFLTDFIHISLKITVRIHKLYSIYLKIELGHTLIKKA